MSSIKIKIDNFLFDSGKDKEYFRLYVTKSAPCISFVGMQVIRLILIIFLLGVWSVNFYINVRKCIMYLNFWALTVTLLYMLWVFPSSGRQVVEKKLQVKNTLEEED